MALHRVDQLRMSASVVLALLLGLLNTLSSEAQFRPITQQQQPSDPAWIPQANPNVTRMIPHRPPSFGYEPQYAESEIDTTAEVDQKWRPQHQHSGSGDRPRPRPPPPSGAPQDPYFGYQPERPPSLQFHGGNFRPQVVLRVVGKQISQDCGPSIYVVTINGTIPGPELRFKEGERLWIRVYNDLPDDNATIHWHGLTMRMSPFSDGTPAASQWPIPPLHYFDYEFQLRRGDAGTYYYHTHVGFTAVTAFGVLIIEENPWSQPRFSYDDERILVFSDVYHKNTTYLKEGLMGSPFRWTGEIENLALNGKAIDFDVPANQRSKDCQLGVIMLEPDTTYRIRFIGGTAISHVFVAFQDHQDMVLIEVDGSYVEPVKVDHIEIHSGQRYSVLLRSKSRSQLQRDQAAGKSQYWIQMETRGRSPEMTFYGVLAYYSARVKVSAFEQPKTKPLTLPNETFTEGWMESQIVTPIGLNKENIIPKATEVTRRVIVRMEQAFSNGLNGFITFHQQGQPWFEHTPAAPYLVSLYKNEAKYFPDYNRAIANGGFDNVTKTFPAKIGEVLEIVWQLKGNFLDGASDSHPMHAHGDHIFDIGTGSGEYNPVQVEKQLLARNYRVLKRDTSILYREPLPQKVKPRENVSWRAWRIRVKNPGVWMMHCHKLHHMVMGMQTVWVFGEAKDLKRLPREMVNGYLDYRGAAYGNATYAPKVVHFWHPE